MPRSTTFPTPAVTVVKLYGSNGIALRDERSDGAALVTQLAHSGNIDASLHEDDVFGLYGNDPVQLSHSKFKPEPSVWETFDNETLFSIQAGVLQPLQHHKVTLRAWQCRSFNTGPV